MPVKPTPVILPFLRTIALQASAAALLLVASFTSMAALLLGTDAGQLAWGRFGLRYPETAMTLKEAATAARAELESLRELSGPVADATWIAARETCEASFAWGRVAVLVGGPLLRAVCRLMSWGAPYLAKGALAAWRFQCSLPTPILFAEAGLASLLIFSIWLKRHFKRKQYLKVHHIFFAMSLYLLGFSAPISRHAATLLHCLPLKLQHRLTEISWSWRHPYQRLARRLDATRKHAKAFYAAYLRRWSALQAEVAVKSRMASAMLPHLVYTSAVVAYMCCFPGASKTIAVQVYTC